MFSVHFMLVTRRDLLVLLDAAMAARHLFIKCNLFLNSMLANLVVFPLFSRPFINC